MNIELQDKVAILIVNGGKDPEQGKWLQLCVDTIVHFTEYSNLSMYIWNNNVEDSWVEDYIRQLQNATLVKADPKEKLEHQHAVPLQRLYEIALNDNPKFIVTMDTDAFPIQKGWLKELIGQMNNGNVLAGVWRDELSEKITPYVHASCLCTSVNFIKKYKLRFDTIPSKSNERHDTLSAFTDKTLEQGLNIYKLKRSNVNQFHPVMGGIYSNMIYHHGAGSRRYVHFWNEKYSMISDHKNIQIRDILTTMLFYHFKEYISWLRGDSASNAFLFILGMHRSGTSCLAGSLEQCGLYLGDVNHYSSHNIKGNFELNDIKNLNDEILKANSGKWDKPPEKIIPKPGHQERINQIVKKISKHLPCGIKDPRLLLTMDLWKNAIANPLCVGTFRHPVSVAMSLKRRNQMPQTDAFNLWAYYNRKLVDLHKKFNFPIIEFDLSNKEHYCDTISMVALEMGFTPNISGLREFVEGKMDHSEKLSRAVVPSSCKDIYQYLKEKSYKIDLIKDSFKHSLLNSMKIMDRKIEIGIKDKIHYKMYQLAGYIPSDIRRMIKKQKRK